MDGHRFVAWVLVGTAALSGCKSQQTTSGMPIPEAASTGSMFERTFTKTPPGPLKPLAPEPEVKETNGPLKSETVAVFADLAVDAAFNNETLSPAERDKRLDTARQKFQVALQQDPKSLDALRGLGRLYTRAGDKERASQTYQIALQAYPKNHTLAHEAALSYGRFEDWQTALTLWQHALTLDPESRKYPRMIGLAQARLGDFEASFNTLWKAGVKEAEARMIMARELIEAGQADAGRQQLELAIKADPNFAPAQQMMQQINGGIQQAGYQQ